MDPRVMRTRPRIQSAPVSRFQYFLTFVLPAVVLFALLFTAMPALAQGGLDAYRLGPGDRLKITVFDHPQESGNFEVDSLGNIAYPLLGRLEARGKTVAEFQDGLTKELDAKFIKDPRVSVEVLNYRPFYIYGEVNRAGSYPYVVGLTVRRAIAIAGGFTRRADQSPINVVRDGKNGPEKIELSLDQPVLPGDILEVDRRLF